MWALFVVPWGTFYYIGTLSQTLTLRAAFASSTYLLPQIPGPGRSSDDDFLNPHNHLFKGAHLGLRAFHRHRGFPCPPTPARHLMTCLNPPNPLFKGAHQASVRTRPQGHRFAVLRPASEDALLTLRTVLFRLPSPEKVYRC